MSIEKKSELDKLIVIPWEKEYRKEVESSSKESLPFETLKTNYLILQEYEEGISEYGMIVEDEKGFPLILSDLKYFQEFRVNFIEKK
jgi:hypothetical protein